VRETRIFTAPIEVREAEAEASPVLSGYGAVFGVEYQVGDFTESVDPKAFNRSLKNNHDHAVVLGHDYNRVLGTEQSGTARFAVDEHGLHYESDLDIEDPDGLSAYRKAKTGRMAESSFSFEVLRDAWEKRESGPPHRTLTEVRLYECSPVLWGANPATKVDVKCAARSLAAALEVDEAESIPEVIDLASQRDATTPDPDDGPPEAPVATQDSEPTRTRPFVDPSF
jgi:HK97 family phage prohead protease